jgi:hypothetical protein
MGGPKPRRENYRPARPSGGLHLLRTGIINVSINCSGTTQTTSVHTPASSRSYQVNGATFSLRLSDGRIAIVNCGSKAPQAGVAVAVALLGGGVMNRRSCRIPLMNDIQAEFTGDKANLKWPVSIDGKKFDSETYKIVAVLEKP